MRLSDLPTLIALFNGLSATLLLFGFVRIKRGDKVGHRKFMISALITTSMFLITYLVYHYNVGSVPYPYHDWTRPIYFAILIPHVILAALLAPFAITIVWMASREYFEKHKRLARYVWPVWMYVSITGIIVYLMMYVRQYFM